MTGHSFQMHKMQTLLKPMSQVTIFEPQTMPPKRDARLVTASPNGPNAAGAPSLDQQQAP